MRIRQPAVAGLFYPNNAQEMDSFMRPYVERTGGRTKARMLIGPHAGYLYSGDICGDGYAAVEIPSSVVLMGPNHTGRGPANAIFSHGAFAMPGATVAVDEPLAAMLTDAMDLVDDEAAHEEEHSLEVHVPFLTAKKPDVKIVPICLGALSYEVCEQMGRGLASVLSRHPDVLVVVSTDLSHYVPASEAARLDKIALDEVEAIEPRRLFDAVHEHHISMCGYVPTTVALVAMRELDAREVRILRYGNSGEVSGDHRRVVGYASAILA